MSYDYQTERPWLFTDEGQRELLKTRDRAFTMITAAGCVRADKIMGSGDSWKQLAIVDRLCELRDLRRIDTDEPSQYRVYVRTGEYR